MCKALGNSFFVSLFRTDYLFPLPHESQFHTPLIPVFRIDFLFMVLVISTMIPITDKGGGDFQCNGNWEAQIRSFF